MARDELLNKTALLDGSHREVAEGCKLCGTLDRGVPWVAKGPSYARDSGRSEGRSYKEIEGRGLYSMGFWVACLSEEGC